MVLEHPLSNTALETLLRNLHNIPILEHCINGTAQEHARLVHRVRTENAAVGAIPRRQDLGELLRDVKEEVDAFLGTDDVPPCTVNYPWLGCYYKRLDEVGRNYTIG